MRGGGATEQNESQKWAKSKKRLRTTDHEVIFIDDRTHPIPLVSALSDFSPLGLW
jgi:hypothetical protein